MNLPALCHRRRPIRLRDYDYSQAGAYNITICTQDRVLLFGTVTGAEMRLSAAGQMIERWWLELANKYPQVEHDAYVLMPNHLHGIIVLETRDVVQGEWWSGSGEPSGAGRPPVSVVGEDEPRDGRPRGAAPTLGEIIGWFKTMTTNEYIRWVKSEGWPPFPGKLWQRNYYEHIVRDDRDLQRIRQYITDNPARWSSDRDNPRRGGPTWPPTPSPPHPARPPSPPLPGDSPQQTDPAGLEDGSPHRAALQDGPPRRPTPADGRPRPAVVGEDGRAPVAGRPRRGGRPRGAAPTDAGGPVDDGTRS